MSNYRPGFKKHPTPVPHNVDTEPRALADVIDAVIDSWSDSVSIGALSEQTLDKFSGVLGRFGRFCHQNGAVTIADVSPELIDRFLTAKGRNRKGAIARAASATIHNRRATLRAFFDRAIGLGLTATDPAARIALPRLAETSRHPITRDQAALIRVHCERDVPTRHASTVALLLIGVHTGELGHIRIRDVDFANGTVWAHGTVKRRARSLDLDPWAQRVLRARADKLRIEPDFDADVTLFCTGSQGSDQHRHARVCIVARQILVRAGLTLDTGVRPSSLTAYAGRCAYERRGLIQDAARLLGYGSLDTAAKIIDLDWDRDDWDPDTANEAASASDQDTLE